MIDTYSILIAEPPDKSIDQLLFAYSGILSSLIRFVLVCRSGYIWTCARKSEVLFVLVKMQKKIISVLNSGRVTSQLGNKL